MLTSLIACVVAAAAAAPVLMAPEQAASNPELVFVDARGGDAFEEAHIPGAVNMPTPMLSKANGDVVNKLKDVESVRDTLAEHGVDPRAHVVVYGSTSSAGALTEATRLFWILEYVGFPRVSLLDGGIETWQSVGYDVESGEMDADAVPRDALDLPVRDDRLATAERVREAMETGSAVLTDARSAEQFTGESKSGAVAKPGHIPGARNLSASKLIDEGTGRFKVLPELQELADQAAGKGEKPAITYCNTARSATLNYVLFRMLGREDVSVYDGSMTEWTRLDDAPVKQGTEE